MTDPSRAALAEIKKIALAVQPKDVPAELAHIVRLCIDALRAPLPGRLDCGAGLPFQKRVLNWLMECFSNEVCRDGVERNHRFLEESLELVQSLGCTRSEAHQLVDYVFDRPVGEPMQELGGVQVTLSALASCHDMDLSEAGETELARVWTKIEKIRAKQLVKPKHSPLPAPPTLNSGAAPIECKADFYALWCDDCRCHPSKCKLRAVLPRTVEGGAVTEGLDWPNESFKFHDEPGEHDPCYIVMPGGAMLQVNHHAGQGVDIARAKFIVNACNAALQGSLPLSPAHLEVIVTEAMSDSWNDICSDTGCHPLDIEHLGNRKLGFHVGHWARQTGKRVAAALSHPNSGDGK